MRLKRGILLLVGFVVVLVLTAYLFVADYFRKPFHENRLSKAECDDPTEAGAPKTNPNKMLFISCGGFLE